MHRFVGRPEFARPENASRGVSSFFWQIFNGSSGSLDRCPSGKGEPVLICGIKASHDGAVAVIEDGRLRFSVETEKLDNGARYSSLDDLRRVVDILASEGLSPADVDQFVVDGWYTTGASGARAVTLHDGDRPVELAVAPYVESPGDEGPLQRHRFDGPFIGGVGHVSFNHVTNHLLGAYCASPIAARGEDALALMWDGGIVPRLYQVRADSREVTLVSALMPITGNSFADFSAAFGPFSADVSGLSADEVIRHHLSIAGKAMAYAALGKAEPDAFSLLDELISGFPGVDTENARILGSKVASNRDELMPGMSDADIIATFQDYLGRRLLDRLAAVVERRFPGQRTNLVLGGGCALNIKWNSAIRASGLFQDVFVPPFPNDAGAAIGTAVCESFHRGNLTLEWDVRSGPTLVAGPVPGGWQAQPCDERQLAHLLHTEGEPVVVLSGRAELGPRALGNRSILAPATEPGMKARLNAIKNRADYRPVAPICLEARAPEVFDPGTPDPYMLFEHRMRPGWAERVPAVVHLDGTARLQTIDERQQAATARVLAAYAEISGVPVLCNTSANFEGRGFFPDVASAARWGGTRYIWSEGVLYTNPVAVTGAPSTEVGRLRCRAQGRMTVESAAALHADAPTDSHRHQPEAG
ncbi:carbamoyltransferase N-terminal domain-containing protein [Micromonospora sp. WMMA1363]|uniref:carbamoyltransferase N-terminal domain-containing protein n=1 Tax=Micromonospora sp. WMMA1363 TaxID=3053985 RepID=UPI00259CF2D8|nr:carbamoyltransferase N-terminal domain-containing protein [Micromonospora sp. WMMA1363]MDM4719718.1 carbamoyltransferase N-terminal domain-containing protein [Micromonospora sp. WMMA1363]